VIYGYARVSTVAQDLANHLAELKAAGCDPIFREKITGTHAERPQLKRLLRKVTHGDVAIVLGITVTVAFFTYYGASPATPGTRLRVGRLRNMENMQVSP